MVKDLSPRHLCKLLAHSAIRICGNVAAILKSDEGIAIQSTYKRLIETLDRNKHHQFAIGKVEYRNYDRESIRLDNMLNLIMHKRVSFEHGKELRVCFIEPNTYVDGVDVTVDLEALIESVYVSPTAQPWQRDVLESILNKLGIKVPVVQSKLNTTPLY